jgi:histidinol-phosphate phosphatase family protein
MESEWIYEVDAAWALFLDRDGVLNRKLEGYVMSPEQLEILPGVLEALFLLVPIFYKIVVVTNQQGIGRELMTHEDLRAVHDSLLREVTNAHGHIDQIYYSPDLAYMDSYTRKPAPGMAIQAKKDFPFIDFEKSIIVGDSQSDIDFGKGLGFKTVWISNERPCIGYDLAVHSLKEFADLLCAR